MVLEGTACSNPRSQPAEACRAITRGYGGGVRVLHVVSSPRGADSSSVAVAEAFLDAYRAHRDDVEVDTLDLWREELPEFDPSTIGVKYKLVSGEDMGPTETAHHARVEALIDRVRAADRIVLGVPMWNWSFPYKLKQFIDLVCLRDRLFTFDGDAYGPALDVERALIVATRGQGHEVGMIGPPPQTADHQVDFVRFWLQMIGVRDVDVVRVEHAWEGASSPSVAAAISDVRRRAATF